MKKNFIYIIVSLILTVIILFGFKSDTQVPLHFNASGVADSYGSKYWLILFSFFPLLLSLLMDLFKKIDPRKANYEKFKKYYLYFNILINTFFYLVIIEIIVAVKFEFNVVMYLLILIGVLFILMGIFLPKIEQNYFIGIRTPWTLNSERVWRKTHILGGKLFVIMGVLFIINSLFKSPLLIVIIILIILYMLYYSYKISKTDKGEQ